ncbi:MAG: S-layer homology domain-containing protein [Clostridia bacterium]|nr:S-layer homology domain-containing protein [Clostridia bacterium]
MKFYLKKLLVLVIAIAMVLPVLPFVKVSSATALITVAKYEERLKAFKADSRFKDGATWGYEQRPKLNTGWSCKGCCAYVADFVKYVYGVNTASWASENFLKYTDINDIKKGDVIYINDAANHWFVVLERNGNSLDVVEGNYGGKVRHIDDGYRIKDGKLYDVKSKKSRPFGYGSHYKFADSMFTVEYDANGGVGDIASKKLNFGAKFSLPTSGVTYDGYDLCGWQVKRSDGKWYVGGTNGWVDEKTMNEKGLRAKVYELDGKKYTMSSNWTTGVERDTTFTFYAYWGFDEYTVKCFDNYSGVNLLHDGAFEGELDSEWYLTRDESVLTLDIDSEVKRTPKYNTLRVDSLAVGKSGKDLGIRTFTSGSSTGNGYVGDDKEMTLSFWAKADTDDINMYVRWGYEPSSEYKKVSFTTEWQYYTVRMDKENTFGNTMHPYFDAAGTVWFSEMQLEDGTEATAFKNDNGEYETILVKDGGTYDTLSVPVREGYTFDGWYTSASGGEMVDSTTPAPEANTILYAHWNYRNRFTDVSADTWYYDAVMYVSQMAYMAGTNADRTLFSPDMNLTREQFIQFLFNMERLSSDDYDGETGFNDVPEGQWYSAAVKWAKEVGVSNGDGKGNFLLGSPVTREQLAQFLMNYSHFKGMNTELEVSFEKFKDSEYAGAYVSSGITDAAALVAAYTKFLAEASSVDFYLYGYEDASSISDWAEKAVAWAIGEGLFTSTGTNVKTVSPLRIAMRSEIAKIALSFDSYLTK